MKNEKAKTNSWLKWVIYGILVAVVAVIFIFHGKIFDADSIFKSFDSQNGFLKYVMNEGIPNLCQTIIIIGICVYNCVSNLMSDSYILDSKAIIQI